MGREELKIGDLVELVKRNPLGFSAYTCKILKVKGNRRLILSVPSLRGKNISLPTIGNYQLRYLTTTGHFKIAVNITEQVPNYSITVAVKGEVKPVLLKDYIKIDCNIAIRFSSFFRDSLRGTGILTDLSGGGAKLITSCLIAVGDTVRFPLELVGCEDMIVMARVIDSCELEENRIYSLAFTDMHMRLRRQLMTYIESQIM